KQDLEFVQDKLIEIVIKMMKEYPNATKQGNYIKNLNFSNVMKNDALYKICKVKKDGDKRFKASTNNDQAE
ncbi:1420_t:CDS:2, partial [Gigaspora margarita]